MPDFMSYYKESYEDSRHSFIELAKSLNVELRSHPVANLSFESFYLPPASGKKEKLLILTSGVHGIEGFTGSALQRYFMEQDFFGLKKDDLGILIIHGINPYGFKHELRVTENNVDLNRNFDVSDDLFKNENSGYAAVYEFLNPKVPYSKLSFYTSALTNIIKHGMDNLRKAILRGQYQFPDGIFFGGQKFEPQVSILKDEILNVAEGYKQALLVDLHTGYGQRSKLHLFGDRSPFIDQHHMNQVFQGLQVDYGQEKDFYAVTGGFTVFLAKLLHKKVQFVGIVFEFGTIDSHKTLGSLESLYRMINKDKKLFREMFYPKSPEWRKAVMEQFESTLKQILK
jgi:Protein of unknown function (DUF2817)